MQGVAPLVPVSTGALSPTPSEYASDKESSVDSEYVVKENRFSPLFQVESPIPAYNSSLSNGRARSTTVPFCSMEDVSSIPLDKPRETNESPREEGEIPATLEQIEDTIREEIPLVTSLTLIENNNTLMADPIYVQERRRRSTDGLYNTSFGIVELAGKVSHPQVDSSLSDPSSSGKKKKKNYNKKKKSAIASLSIGTRH